MKLLLKFVIGIVILFVVLLGVAYLLLSIPKKVNTKWTEKDYKSFIEKAKVAAPNSESDKVGIEDMINGGVVDTGHIQLNDVTFTASEIAAFVNTDVKTDVISNFNIAFTDDSMILTFNVGKNVTELMNKVPEAKKYENYINMAIGKPVYWEFTDAKATDKTFTSTTRQFYVGQLELPEDVVKNGLSELRNVVNDTLSRLNNFKVDEYKIDKAGLHFTGTIPEMIRIN